MKKKILLGFFLLTVSVSMFIGLTASNSPDEKFIIAAMHSGIDTTVTNYMRLKDSLNMNGWHKYNQWFTGDEITSDISFIAPRVQYRVNENNSRDLRTLFGRRITDYTCWGQRSDYQCENVTVGSDHWWYAYNTSVTGTNISDISDSGATVKYCQTIPSSPGSGAGYIVKELRANREQANKVWTPYQSDSFSAWYVKPRIRIDSAFANNPSNFNLSVCRIDVFDWDSNIVKSADIKVRNFKTHSHPDSIYRGNYLEEFFFSPHQDTSSLIISPGAICPGTAKDFGNWSVPVHTDFRVYWYGECDMWIDRIRVENEQAVKLFTDNLTQQRIRSEVNSALLSYDASRPNHFYIEEFEFNTTPCLKKVREIIEDESQGKLTLITNLNPYLYNFHVPYYSNNPFTAEDFDKYLVDPVTGAGIKKIATTLYFLEGFEDTTNRFSKNPNTLPVYQANPSWNYYPAKGILAYKDSPSAYDDWLQFNFDEMS